MQKLDPSAKPQGLTFQQPPQSRNDRLYSNSIPGLAATFVPVAALYNGCRRPSRVATQFPSFNWPYFVNGQYAMQHAAHYCWLASFRAPAASLDVGAFLHKVRFLSITSDLLFLNWAPVCAYWRQDGPKTPNQFQSDPYDCQWNRWRISIFREPLAAYLGTWQR